MLFSTEKGSRFVVIPTESGRLFLANAVHRESNTAAALFYEVEAARNLASIQYNLTESVLSKLKIVRDGHKREEVDLLHESAALQEADALLKLVAFGLAGVDDALVHDEYVASFV